MERGGPLRRQGLRAARSHEDVPLSANGQDVEDGISFSDMVRELEGYRAQHELLTANEENCEEEGEAENAEEENSEELEDEREEHEAVLESIGLENEENGILGSDNVLGALPEVTAFLQGLEDFRPAEPESNLSGNPEEWDEEDPIRYRNPHDEHHNRLPEQPNANDREIVEETEPQNAEEGEHHFAAGSREGNPPTESDNVQQNEQEYVTGNEQQIGSLLWDPQILDADVLRRGPQDINGQSGFPENNVDNIQQEESLNLDQISGANAILPFGDDWHVQLWQQVEARLANIDGGELQTTPTDTDYNRKEQEQRANIGDNNEDTNRLPVQLNGVHQSCLTQGEQVAEQLERHLEAQPANVGGEVQQITTEDIDRYIAEREQGAHTDDNDESTGHLPVEPNGEHQLVQNLENHRNESNAPDVLQFLDNFDLNSLPPLSNMLKDNLVPSIVDNYEGNRQEIGEDRQQENLDPTEDSNQALLLQTQKDAEQTPIGRVEHDQQNLATLQWIESMLRIQRGEIDIGNNPRQEVRNPQGAQNHDRTELTQYERHRAEGEIGSLSTTGCFGISERRLGLHNGRRKSRARAEEILQYANRFYWELLSKRTANMDHMEISRCIEVTKPPELHLEMDAAFQPPTMDLISWTRGETTSPTLNSIAKDVTHDGHRFVVSEENVFNNVFHLSRKSFLQREETAHVEFLTHFFNILRSEEQDKPEIATRELVTWLEEKFNPTLLATMMQELVNAIDKDYVMRYIAARAKAHFTRSHVQLAMTEAFLQSTTEHFDILEKEKEVKTKKKQLDKAVKAVHDEFKKYGIAVPSGNYGKTKDRDGKTLVSREKGMIRTFIGTRWLACSLDDAHYVYGRSVLAAANEVRTTVEILHGQALDELKRKIVRPVEGRDGVAAVELVVERTEMIQKYEEEKGRPVNSVEGVALNSFMETVAGLSKIKIKDVVFRIGGEIPDVFERVLNEIGDDVECLRGCGYTGGLGVLDLVQLRDKVETRAEALEQEKKRIERKREYLTKCRDILIAELEKRNGGHREDDGAGPAPR